MTITTDHHADTCFNVDPAALADAAYRELLRHGLGINWLDIQLVLWQAVSEKVQQLERDNGKSAAFSQVHSKLESLLI